MILFLTRKAKPKKTRVNQIQVANVKKTSPHIRVKTDIENVATTFHPISIDKKTGQTSKKMNKTHMTSMYSARKKPQEYLELIIQQLF